MTKREIKSRAALVRGWLKNTSAKVQGRTRNGEDSVESWRLKDGRLISIGCYVEGVAPAFICLVEPAGGMQGIHRAIQGDGE